MSVQINLLLSHNCAQWMHFAFRILPIGVLIVYNNYLRDALSAFSLRSPVRTTKQVWRCSEWRLKPASRYARSGWKFWLIAFVLSAFASYRDSAHWIARAPQKRLHRCRCCIVYRVEYMFIKIKTIFSYFKRNLHICYIIILKKNFVSKYFLNASLVHGSLSTKRRLTNLSKRQSRARRAWEHN